MTGYFHGSHHRGAGVALAALAIACTLLSDAPKLHGNPPPAPVRPSFAAWLSNLEHRGDAAEGLYPYFQSREPDFRGSADDFLSPMVSAKCVLFWLDEGDSERALRTAQALRRWQEHSRPARHVRTHGALPSQIVRSDNAWTASDRYYSGDNLVVLAAYLAVHERTGDPDYLLGARQIADWLVDVMCQGVRAGVWVDDHGAPMQFVTKDGAIHNKIYTAVEFLWLDALLDCSEALSDPRYARQYEKARAFLLSGQAAWGPWYDHYDPGYPPLKYDRSRWLWYGGNRPVIVADNTVRAALGALRVGDPEAARRFVSWMGSKKGAVPAYLDANTSAGHFDSPTVPYYDVVASGLWRELCAALGEEALALRADAFLARVQNRDGGWYWGIEIQQFRPVQRSEAVLTGYWAVTKSRDTPNR